jgi:hypothetical protein
LEPALVERLVADAADEPGVLPLLQETMRLLWAERRRRYLPLSAYERLERDGRSGLAVAVATKADAALGELTPDQQQIARRILLALVQFGQGCSDTRRQQPLEELRLPAAAPHPADFDHVLNHLTCNRLLILSGEETGRGALVDLSHEALITGWPRLQRWLQEDRAGLLVHRRLTEAAAEWHDRGNDTSFLIGGVPLAEALAYAGGHPAELSTEERGFLTASSAREASRERTAYIGQAAGGAVGAAAGYSLAFALGFAHSEKLGSSLLITALVMFPLGQLVGFFVGLQLWLFRRTTLWRTTASAIGGALAGGVSYGLFVWIGLVGDVEVEHVAAGVLLGTGLGLGAGVARNADERVLTTTAGGVVAMALAMATGGIPWNADIVLVAGLVLGGLTGVGLWATAVRPPHETMPQEEAGP